MATALAIVESEVRELVRLRSLDPVLEPESTRRLVDEVVADYLDRTLMSTLPPLGDSVLASRSVFDEVAGFGPLQPYFDDPQVEEIWTYGRPPLGFSGMPWACRTYSKMDAGRPASHFSRSSTLLLQYETRALYQGS